MNQRKLVVIFSIFLVIILLAAFLWISTQPAGDPAALLECCHLALKDFQSTGSYQTTQGSDGYGVEWVVLDTPGGYQNLDFNTRRYLLIATSADGALYRLHYQGQFLERAVTVDETGNTTDSGWYFADWSGSSSFSPSSTVDLDWDKFKSVTVTNVARQKVKRHPDGEETVDATVVVLRMEDEKRPMEYKFYLDGANKLFRINTTYLLSNDRNDATLRLQQCHREAMADMQHYLSPCLQTLDSLRNSELLNISTMSKTSNTPTLSWVRDGDGLLTSRFENDVVTMAMEYGGQRFRREQSYDNQYLIGDTGWYPTEDAPTAAELPPFLTMDWRGATVSNVSKNIYSHNVELTHPETGETLTFEYDPETGALQNLFFGGCIYILNPTEDAPGSLEWYYRQAVSPETAAETANEAKFREIVEFLQNGSYSLVQADKDGSISMLRFQCFKAGSNLLIQRSDTGEQYLRYGGQDYYGNADGWTEADFGDFSHIDDWILDDLRMDSPRVFVQPRSYNRVAVLDETLPRGYYIVDFEFNDEGYLISLTRKYQTNDSPNWVHTVITVHHPDPEATANYLQGVFDEIPK